MAKSSNLFDDIPTTLPSELTETLLQSDSVRIERIVSGGQCSPEGFWYDQDEHEWVLILAGAARLEFEGRTVELAPGDYLNIAAHERHRVAWTDPLRETIWLAVFYR